MRITFEPETEQEKQNYPKALCFEGVFEFGLIGHRKIILGDKVLGIEPVRLVRYSSTNPSPLIEKAYGLLRYLEWLAMGLIPPPRLPEPPKAKATDGDQVPS